MCCICTCDTWLVPTPGGKRVTNYVSWTRTIRECRQLCYMCTCKTGLAHTSVGKRVTNYVYGTRTIIQCRQLCYICTCKTWLSHTYVGKWVTNYVYGTWTIRECRQLYYIWVTKYVCRSRTMYMSCTLLKSAGRECRQLCYMCTCKTWLAHTSVGKWVTNYVYGARTTRKCGRERFLHRYSSRTMDV